MPQLKENEQLQIYETLLRKWNEKINLVARNTVQDIWTRHFEDSAQLLDVYKFPEGAVVADIGSGAGFPGLVLALLRPDMDVHLIESDARKCAFLQAVSRETKVSVTVHNARAEEILGKNFYVDVITARALAELDKLLEYVQNAFVRNENCAALFLKGGKAAEEIRASERNWMFREEIHPSRTGGDGNILEISELRRRDLRCA